jgi:hypothetical protein
MEMTTIGERQYIRLDCVTRRTSRERESLSRGKVSQSTLQTIIHPRGNQRIATIPSPSQVEAAASAALIAGLQRRRPQREWRQSQVDPRGDQKGSTAIARSLAMRGKVRRWEWRAMRGWDRLLIFRVSMAGARVYIGDWLLGACPSTI